MGEEYDPDRAPPQDSDFPIEVHYAFQIYGALPTTYAGMGSYTGKDWSSLLTMYHLFKIPAACEKIVFDILIWLDNRNIKKAAEEAKKAAKKK